MKQQLQQWDHGKLTKERIHLAPNQMMKSSLAPSNNKEKNTNQKQRTTANNTGSMQIPLSHRPQVGLGHSNQHTSWPTRGNSLSTLEMWSFRQTIPWRSRLCERIENDQISKNQRYVFDLKFHEKCWVCIIWLCFIVFLFHITLHYLVSICQMIRLGQHFCVQSHHWAVYIPFTCRNPGKLPHEQWRTYPGSLGYIRDEILPTYVGIIIKHYIWIPIKHVGFSGK